LLKQVESELQVQDCLVDGLEIGVDAASPGDEQLIPPFTYGEAPDDFSEAPLYAVTINRFRGYSTPDHEAEPCVR
jgi:hypothetical protein